ncbi:MAG: hypothetical protein ACYC3V_15450, partial [Chloroflexota bacterium]
MRHVSGVFSRSLRNSLVLLCFITALVPLCLVTFFSYRNASDALRGQMNGRLSMAAGQQAASLGAGSVQKSVQGMAAIKASTDSVAARIQELEGYSEQINSIVETIDDIAEQ